LQPTSLLRPIIAGAGAGFLELQLLLKLVDTVVGLFLGLLALLVLVAGSLLRLLALLALFIEHASRAFRGGILCLRNEIGH
jgi:hypothetical protein